MEPETRAPKRGSRLTQDFYPDYHPKAGERVSDAYVKQPKWIKRAFAFIQGADPATYDLGRMEMHHRIILNLLDPFIEGRSDEEVARILKAVNRKTKVFTGNAPENLILLTKELHKKMPTSAHSIIKTISDIQGANALEEYSEVSKINGVSYGKKHGKTYNITKQRSGFSQEFLTKAKLMNTKEAADAMSLYLDVHMPTLDGAILAALHLDPEVDPDFLAGVMERFGPNSEKYLNETIANLEEQTKAALGIDWEKVNAGDTTKATLLNQQRHQGILDKIETFKKSNRVYVDDLSSAGKRRVRQANIGFADEALDIRGATSGLEDLDDYKDIKNLNTLMRSMDGSQALQMTMVPGIGLEDVDRVTQGAVNLGKEVVQDTKDWVKNVPEASRVAQYENVSNLKAFAKPGTTLGRRIATVMPFVGAGADVWDVTERYKTMMDDPNEGFADVLDKVQFGIASAAVGTTWYAEPVNTALGITNLAIDLGRTIGEEDKRKAAAATLRSLGTSGMHGIRNLTKNLW